MLRLIGILTGSAIAIAFLIIALGVPEFSRPAPEQEVVAAIPVDAEPEPAPGSVPEPEPEPAPEPEPQPAPEPILEPAPEPLVEVEPAPDTDAMIEDIFNPAPQPIVEENWYAFWSPFRSEIAANGFVSKLQEATGIDYRVVKVKTGVYEVAFAYTDDADIQNKLARISSATGLNMTDG